MARNEPMGKSKDPMNLTDFRVYHSLRGHCEAGNLVRVPQSLMAERAGIAPSHFSEAVKRLETMGLVERGEKVGRSYPLRIHPLKAWNGTGEAHIRELHMINGGI